MNEDPGYSSAREAVIRAAEAYQAALTNDAAISARDSTGMTPWVPVYWQLLADLRATLQAAGEEYDRTADAAGVRVEDRVDWRAFMNAGEEPAPRS